MLPRLRTIAATLALLVESGVAVAQADQAAKPLPSLPDFYGLYAIDRGALIELGDGKLDEAQRALTPEAQFLLFEEKPTLLGQKMILRRCSILRYKIVGNFATSFALGVGAGAITKDLLAMLDYQASNQITSQNAKDPMVEFRVKPVEGHERIVQIVPRQPLVAGYYSLKSLTGSSYLFGVDASSAVHHYVDRWDLMGLGVDATYHETSLLDESLKKLGMSIRDGRAVAGPAPATGASEATTRAQSDGPDTLRARIADQYASNLRVPVPKLEWRELAALKLAGKEGDYSELYIAGLNRRSLSQDCLSSAAALLGRAEKLDDASRFVEAATRYFIDSNTLFSAAERILGGSAETVASVVVGVYRAATTAEKIVAFAACGMPCYEVTDYLFMVSDFAVTHSIDGMDEARREAVTGAVVNAITTGTGFGDWPANRGIGLLGQSGLPEAVQASLASPGFKEALEKALTASAAAGAVEAGEAVAEAIIRAIVDRVRTGSTVRPDAVEPTAVNADAESSPAITLPAVIASAVQTEEFHKADRSRLTEELTQDQLARIGELSLAGRAAMKKGDFAAGAEKYEALIKVDSKNFEALANLVSCYIVLGYPDKALMNCGAALERLATPELVFLASSCLLKQGRPDDALQWLEAALKAGYTRLDWVKVHFEPLKDNEAYLRLQETYGF